MSSDFRSVGGIQVPHLVEISAAGMPAPIRIVMEKVEWNVRLPREQFSRPK